MNIVTCKYILIFLAFYLCGIFESSFEDCSKTALSYFLSNINVFSVNLQIFFL